MRWTALLVAGLLLASGCLGAENAGQEPAERAPGAGDAVDPGDGPGAPPWPSLEEALLRPGDKLFPADVDPEGGTIVTCTVNFVFTSPGNATLYIGAASHCVDGMRLGDELRLSGDVRGLLAYCSWGTMDESEICTEKVSAGIATTDEAGIANDLALFRIHPEDRDHVHPALRTWGGPTNLAGDVDAGMIALTYGNSVMRDGGRDDVHAGDDREGVVTEKGAWKTRVLFPAPTLAGDSGSPVITGDGSALGIVTTAQGTTTGVLNLEPALAYLHEHTDLTVELATWPQLQDPALDPLGLVG